MKIQSKFIFSKVADSMTLIVDNRMVYWNYYPLSNNRCAFFENFDEAIEFITQEDVQHYILGKYTYQF